MNRQNLLMAAVAVLLLGALSAVLVTQIGDAFTSVPDATGIPRSDTESGASQPSVETVPGPSIEATLVEVVDGDTIWVRLADGTKEKVRYIGMDAPEVAHAGSSGEFLGAEATVHNEGLLASGPLRLQTDVDERDDFDRLLAYVWAGDVFVNEQMVADGYAVARNYPPNLAHQQQLWDADDAAREAGIGIWHETGG